ALAATQHECAQLGIGVNLGDDLVQSLQDRQVDAVLLPRAVEPDARDVPVPLELDVVLYCHVFLQGVELTSVQFGLETMSCQDPVLADGLRRRTTRLAIDIRCTSDGPS